MPGGQINDLVQKETEKIELVARPDVSLWHAHDSVADVQEGGPLVGVVFPAPTHQSIHAVRAVVGSKTSKTWFLSELAAVHQKFCNLAKKMCLSS